MINKHPVKLGATLSIDLQRVSNGGPVSLTGYQIASSIRHPQFGDFEMKVERVNDPEGIIRLVLNSEDTMDLFPGDYYWDIVFTDPNGIVEIFPKDNKTVFSFGSGATQL